MPLKHQNKPKTAAKSIYLRKHIMAIKRRLIEISIRVDGYIYKNKPITVEEAQNYVREISLYRSQCNNDTHILQVIEKLTRCMGTIMEETAKKIQLNPNVTPSGNGQSIDLFSQSSSINNNHEESMTKRDSGNLRAAVVLAKNNKDQISNCAHVTVISDDLNKGKSKKDNEISVICNKDTNNITKGSDLNFSQESKKVKFYKSPILVANKENAKQLQTDPGGCVTNKPKEIINGNSYIILEYSENKRKDNKKNAITIQNTQQIFMPAIKHTKPRNANKKKHMEVTKKSLILGETSELNAAVNTKNTLKKIKTVSEKKNYRQPKQTTKLSGAKNKIKKSTNKNKKTVWSNFQELINPTPPSNAPVKKHTQIDVINDELSLPMPRDDTKAVRHEVYTQDLITKEMSALKIYNEYVLSDLSWIENIRYVREISSEELDQTRSGFSEVFWNNFSLPNEWSNVDFLD